MCVFGGDGEVDVDSAQVEVERQTAGDYGKRIVGECTTCARSGMADFTVGDVLMGRRGV